MVENEIITTENKTTELTLPNINWTKELTLVKEITAKNATETEFKLFLFMAKKYDLDPLQKQIWFIKYENSPCIIFASHAGLCQIAHRSGQFDSMETTFIPNDKIPSLPYSATTKIWRKDSKNPFCVTVLFNEYNQKRNLWLTKPFTMLEKVSEVQCLRRAFSISNLYAPEEIDERQVIQNGTGKQ